MEGGGRGDFAVIPNGRRLLGRKRITLLKKKTPQKKKSSIWGHSSDQSSSSFDEAGCKGVGARVGWEDISQLFHQAGWLMKEKGFERNLEAGGRPGGTDGGTEERTLNETLRGRRTFLRI